GKKYKIEKINMEGLKGPYIMLSNHMAWIDFELHSMGTFPSRINNVVTLEGFFRRPWLLELIGAIGTRRYTKDLHLIKSIRKVLNRGDILCMYPEARYTLCGTLAVIPDSLGKLVRLNQLPVVVVVHHGNHLHAPFWNVRKKRKVPLYTTMTQVITAEQATTLSSEEINKILKDALSYDDYQYQKDNDILITEPFRAEGLHKILYQCPHCKTESQMDSKGTEIFCTSCGKRWNLNEDGTLTANKGETEFSHVPDWFEWERKQVRSQIERGEYCFDDEVDVYSFPRVWRFMPLGKGRLTHDPENGFILQGFYNQKDYCIHRSPLETSSLHIEYDYHYIKPFDCVDISTENDSFYCYPKQKNVVTKLVLATEEIYKISQSNRKKRHSDLIHFIQNNPSDN
ncbi:MAG: hypothetical protein IKU10_01780, partial [Clostridia bacterium]|nr:hypothetical protein [Clostridia bacterium]